MSPERGFKYESRKRVYQDNKDRPLDGPSQKVFGGPNRNRASEDKKSNLLMEEIEDLFSPN